MSEIEIREIPAVPAIYAVASCLHTEIGPTLGALYQKVGEVARKQGATMAGPPFARYTRWEDKDCTLEGGMPITEPVEGEGDVLAGTLGGGLVARTIHVGPYDTMTATHMKVMHWIEENGKTMAGDPWETYLTDPGANPDTSTWQTEICWPIK